MPAPENREIWIAQNGIGNSQAFKGASKEILVCSTGRIGVQITHESVTAGIADACQDTLDELDGGKAFQEAILTSDTRTKSCSAQIETPSGKSNHWRNSKGCGYDSAQHGYHAGLS